MTTQWNTRKTVPLSEYMDFKNTFENYKQINIEQFVEGATDFYDPPPPPPPPSADDDDDIRKKKCPPPSSTKSGPNITNLQFGASSKSTTKTPPFGSVSWLLFQLGIDIKLPPKKKRGFSPIGNTYKPKNRGNIERLKNRVSGAYSSWNNIIDYPDVNMSQSYNKFFKNKVKNVYNADGSCVNNENVEKDSNIIANEMSKLLLLPLAFWITYSFFYISIYQNVNCYQVELPNVWNYFMKIDSLFGGNSLFPSLFKYILEFAIYAPHTINQILRKMICSIPYKSEFASLYFFIIINMVIGNKIPEQIKELMKNSLKTKDTSLNGLAFIITTIGGLNYYYKNWWSNPVLSLMPIPGIIIKIIVFIINVLFISLMTYVGMPIITLLFFTYAFLSLFVFDMSGDGIFGPLTTIQNINDYIYKTIFNSINKDGTFSYLSQGLKYIFYFIIEIVIIMTLSSSIQQFNNMNNSKLRSTFIIVYLCMIIFIAMFAYIRYEYDPSMDSNIFSKILSTIFTGSMNFINEYYSHIEMQDCNAIRAMEPNEFTDCNIDIVAKETNFATKIINLFSK